MVKSGISQEEIIAWGGSAVFNQGLKIVQDGLVTDVSYDDDKLMVHGKITQPSGWGMPVSFKLKPGGSVFSYCPCDINRTKAQICPHVTAVAIALMVSEMDDEEEKLTSNPDIVDKPKVEEKFIEVPAFPKFEALVAGTRASLSVLLLAKYADDLHFPAMSDQSPRKVYLEDPEDPLVRRVRNLKAEEEAAKLLWKYGFDKGYTKTDPRMYLTDQVKLLNFLGAGLPFLRRHGVRCTLSDRLQELYDSMRSLVPVVKVKDVPGENAFDVSCRFDTDGLNVSAADVQQAMNRGDSYVLKDGVVTLFDSSAIEEMRGVFRDTVSRQGGAERGWFRVPGVHSAYVKSALDAISDTIDIEDGAAKNWRRRATVLNREEGTHFEFCDLGRLEQTLRIYQKHGVCWMHHLEKCQMGGLLADEMGLGKTLQTLTWLSIVRKEKKGLPFLIVCPTSLVRNWESEAKKFVPWLKTLVVSGPDRAETFARFEEADIVITSYALLQRDFDEAYLARKFEVVVLDEAQHIKNRKTNNARAAKRIESNHRLVLTGTPIENSVADVWSIFDFLMPGYLGDYESFKANYELPIQDGGEEGRLAQEKLKRKLHPFILRRLKREVARDLPDKLVRVFECVMSDKAMREYIEVKGKERAKAKTKFQMLALLMKLRRIASAGKVEAFMEQLDEAIDGGHRILVFSQFVSQLEVLKKELDKAGIKYCYLDGSTKDRLGECNRFNMNRDIPVFLISLMAGGTGFNLVGADMVIHYDPWWNPAVEDQATDRAHRIGQKKKVYVMKLIAHDSVEEKVLALQRKKQAVIAATVAASDEAIANSLTLEELSDLLK